METPMTIQQASDLAGQSATAVVNETAEATYWSQNYSKRGYVERDRPYADYEPAYQYGWESRARLGSKAFREVEAELAKGWETAKSASKLAWTQARSAVSDAWHRAGRPAAAVEPVRDGA
jgi:hypothetical protein